jgi:hypothetical protein
MERKYLFFHTAKAAVFLFYALVFLLLSLLYAKFTQNITGDLLVKGSILYLAVVVLYSVSLDRTKRGLTQ